MRQPAGREAAKRVPVGAASAIAWLDVVSTLADVVSMQPAIRPLRPSIGSSPGFRPGSGLPLLGWRKPACSPTTSPSPP